MSEIRHPKEKTTPLLTSPTAEKVNNLPSHNEHSCPDQSPLLNINSWCFHFGSKWFYKVPPRFYLLLLVVHLYSNEVHLIR